MRKPHTIAHSCTLHTKLSRIIKTAPSCAQLMHHLHCTKEISLPVLPLIFPSVLLIVWPALLKPDPADEVTLESPSEAFEVALEAASLALDAVFDAASVACDVEEA